MVWLQRAYSFVVERLETAIPLGRRIVLLTVLLLVAVYSGNILILVHYYNTVATREHAARDAKAGLLAEQAGRAIAAVDLSLETIADSLKAHLPLKQPAVFMQLLLDKYLKQLPEVRTLGVIGPDGRIVNTTRAFPPPSVSLADRPYFSEQKKLLGVGLYIGRVETSRVDHKPFFGASRPILDEYGNFEGIVLAVVEPQYFANYYGSDSGDSYDGDTDDVALLERDDGSVLASAGLSARAHATINAAKTDISERKVHGFPLKIVLIGKPVISSPQFVGFIGLDAGPLIIMTIIALWLATMAARETTAVSHEARARQMAEARLLSAIESAPAAVALYDNADRLVLSNDLYGSFFEPLKEMIVPGILFKDLAEAALARHAYAAHHLDDPEFLHRRLENHRTGSKEPLIQLRDGRWVLVRERRTKEDDTVIFFTDVTLLKEREEELKRLNQVQSLFVDALEHIPSSIMLCDTEDRILICNSATRRYFPRATDLLVPGTRFEDLLRAHAASGYVKDVGNDLSAWIADRMKQHRAANANFIRAYDDGHWSDIIERRTADGGIIGIRTDITALKQTEQALRRSEHAARAAREEAEQANQAKTAFLATMSHELRTPLNAIIGFSEMIERTVMGPISETYRKYGEIVRTSGQHLLAIINDILDVAKLNSGKTELHLEPVDINQTIADAVAIVSARADSAGVHIASKLDATCPMVEADALRLRQVLLNVLTNAIKFTPAGGRVEISTSAQPGEAQIVVQDTGTGIAPEDIPRVLEPFTQVGPDKGGTREGTGLGLPISKKLVELHGGRFAIASALNVGTTVTIVLPVQRAVQPAPEPAFDIAV